MTASIVSVNHEWGALREVIVGVQPRGTMLIPSWYEGFSWMGPEFKQLTRQMGGRLLADVDPGFDLSLERQTDALAELLAGRGVTVHRGRPLDDAEAAGPRPASGTLFVRDPTLVIGGNIIEVNLRMRTRRTERHSVRNVLEQIVVHSDAVWVAMPAAWPGPDERDEVSAFLEGGDTLLNGWEIYVGVSGTSSNQRGIDWLQRFLGPRYRVQAIALRPDVLHLDCALALVRPGLGLICRARINGALPDSLRAFRWIEVSDAEAENLGTNGLILDETALVVDSGNRRVADELRHAGQEVLLLDYDGPIRIGGGMRCSHHPLRRDSSLH